MCLSTYQLFLSAKHDSTAQYGNWNLLGFVMQVGITGGLNHNSQIFHILSPPLLHITLLIMYFRHVSSTSHYIHAHQLTDASRERMAVIASFTDDSPPERETDSPTNQQTR